MSCCDIFGNQSDALCGTDGGGNFSFDPQFCAVDPVTTRLVTLQSDSPCAPGNHPDAFDCGLIGAGLVDCAAVAVELRTWTKIKSTYR
jgi:hypothetical protein